MYPYSVYFICHNCFFSVNILWTTIPIIKYSKTFLLMSTLIQIVWMYEVYFIKPL